MISKQQKLRFDSIGETNGSSILIFLYPSHQNNVIKTVYLFAFEASTRPGLENEI